MINDLMNFWFQRLDSLHTCAFTRLRASFPFAPLGSLDDLPGQRVFMPFGALTRYPCRAEIWVAYNGWHCGLRPVELYTAPASRAQV